MSFEITHRFKNARVGKLKTKSGEYETPFFMPVATKGAIKHIDVDDLEEIGVKNIISNALILYLRPGIELIKKHNSIHGFMNWKHCSFTDSGGFQVLSLDNFNNGFNDDFFSFKCPFDGSIHYFNTKKIMEIEEAIGADVAMAIDHMPLCNYSKEKVIEATNRTHKWAEECLRYHNDKSQLLFGICQGGLDEELRKKSARFISSLDFDGIAIGGLAIGESKELMRKMLKASLGEIPKEKPRYLMGVGSARELIDFIELGIDMFDSVWPTRLARHSTALTHKGNISLEKSIFKKEMSVVDSECDCKVCKNYTKSYLHHLFRTKEPLASRLISFHNIYFLQKLIERAREAIKNNKWKEFKNEYKNA